MSTTIYLLAAIGFLLSVYAWYVRWRASRSDEYKPLCDVSAHISCTKAFLSKEGRLGGFPNPIYGILYYGFIVLLLYDNLPRAFFWITVFGVIGSCYLAFVSYVRQRNFCLVCSAIYLINIFLFIMAAGG